jgi:hypothetical protein
MQRKIPHVFKLIGERATTLAHKFGHYYDTDEIAFTVYASHKKIPLRLQELLEADDGNFAHDVFGIMRHFNVLNEKMRDCFVPRFARQQ